MMDTIGCAARGRTYAKPTLTLVELVTDEAVFSGCKLPSTSSGPGDTSGCQPSNYSGTSPCQQLTS